MEAVNSPAPSFTHFDLSQTSTADTYKLLASLIMPRPIAWITSRAAAGGLNAAPFSFFNVLSSEPPIVAVGFSGAPDRDGKDTLANILERRHFVVNLVPEELAEAMSLTATNAPRGLDETVIASLETAPSVVVDIPRLAGSPAAFECRLYQAIWPGPRTTIVLAQVLHIHVRTEAFEDAARLHIDPDRLRLVGRMQGAGGYATTRDLFHIERRSWPLENGS